MERRSVDGAVAMTTTTEEGRSLLGVAAFAFDALPSQAERSLAQRLSQELADGPAHARVRAASSLADVAGIYAAPLLAWAIDDADPDLRVALADALGRAGGADAIAAVDVLRRDEDALVRAAAVDAAARLLERDPDALREVFREAIADADPRVRRRAALQAASTRGIDPGELLARVLEDDDRQARRLAAVALGSTRRKDAALALVDALLDEDDSVREAATGSASLLFGEEAERIAALEPLRRGRAVARLRAFVAASATLPESAEAWRAERLSPSDVANAVSKVEETSDVAALQMDEASDIAALQMEETSDVAALQMDESSDVGTLQMDESSGIAIAASDSPSSYLPLVDAEPAMRLDHELDEDVLAVMHALSLARASVPARAVAPADETEASAAVGTSSDDVPRVAPDAGPEFDAIESVLRAALRGATPEDLANELGLSALALGPVLDEHLDAGRIVRRGKKLFLP